ncbi:MAG: ATP-binding protein [Spirochaetota bacterium]
MRKARVNRNELRKEIARMLKKVAFSQTAVHVCEHEATVAQEEFLYTVLSQELANREQVRKARRLREAAFPVYKTLEGYDFQNVKLPPTISREEVSSGVFVSEKKNIVMYGPVGTGNYVK